LMYFGTLGDGLLLQGRNKKPSRHSHDLNNIGKIFISTKPVL
jgi:hypothetical protein